MVLYIKSKLKHITSQNWGSVFFLCKRGKLNHIFCELLCYSPALHYFFLISQNEAEKTKPCPHSTIILLNVEHKRTHIYLNVVSENGAAHATQAWSMEIIFRWFYVLRIIKSSHSQDALGLFWTLTIPYFYSSTVLHFLSIIEYHSQHL